jgi:aldose 1-epimerase
MKQIIIAMLAFISCVSCSEKKQNMDKSTDSLALVTMPELELYSLTNKNGLAMTVTNFGGRIVTLLVPDKNGEIEDVVLGYDSLKKYLTEGGVYGALIGRFGNRIAKGKFKIDGAEYNLAVNNGVNSLHGGPTGFHNQYWDATEIKNGEADALELHYKSIDGEEGYPGTLDVKVTYTLTDQNEVVIDYEAITDKATIINLTHHSFFNLQGEGKGDILGHQFIINADRFTPVDDGLIPTGEIRSVKGTPFDFLTTHTVGERINKDDEQLKFGRGYDHNWVLNKKEVGSLTLAATVTEPTSGRIMEVLTTEPAMQFYTGNFMSGKDIGKSSKPYLFRSAFCLETQHFPDGPNHENFPNTILRPGETYKTKTIYKFGVVR